MPEAPPPRLGRRRVLRAGGAVVGLGAAGAVGWELAPPSFTERLLGKLGIEPEAFVPDAPEGEVRLERVTSAAMGELDLFTAVPAGHGDGAGLPVVVVLHGASATAADLRGFGFGRFVTAAVEAGAPPFVLAGTDDGPAGWVASGDVDPPRMLRDELPGWLAERGFDGGRRALWGWSRGGYGALRFVTQTPDWARALALFSPALGPDDQVLSDLDVLTDLPWGLWCGEWDPFREGSVALAAAAPVAPDPWVSGEGGHTRAYWNSHTLEMLDGLARSL
ncbi:alpha/beta hydrolase-fold protein [Nocardioides sp.]|uniref:alpha/beta hydrolase n=1 Tax=Nocardioides sp. TaxID=35761 RepID=UPI00286A47A7|nr:alpha/beta hydrolase-fold protein [Nocardioides sp.]